MSKRRKKRCLWIATAIMALLLLAVPPLPAQILTGGAVPMDIPAWTTSDIIASTDTSGAADTSASAIRVKLYCARWPYEQWSLGVKLTPITGHDPADSLYGRVWYKYDASGAWSAKVTVLRLGGTPSGKWVYGEIPRPAAKPCSIYVDAWGYDATTCSTKVEAKIRAQ